MCGESEGEVDDEDAEGGVYEDVEKVEGARVLLAYVGNQSGKGDVEDVDEELAEHLLGYIKDPKGGGRGREGGGEAMFQRKRFSDRNS